LLICLIFAVIAKKIYRDDRKFRLTQNSDYRKDRSMHMEPAKSILDLIGVESAARVTGKSISRIYRWMYPAGPRQGTGGVIPHGDALKLLDYGREQDLRWSNGAPLQESDFLRKPSIAIDAKRVEEQGAA
jgi:hypothetical protein